MMLKDPVTNTTSTDARRNAEIYREHLVRAHSVPTPYDQQAVDEIPQQPPATGTTANRAMKTRTTNSVANCARTRTDVINGQESETTLAA